MAPEKPAPDDPTPTPRSSRRDFLKGRAALRTLANKAQNAVDAATSALDPQPTSGQSPSAQAPTSQAKVTLLQASRRAMACEFQVQYHATDGPHATEHFLAALENLEPLEAQLTVYREQSEVLDVNQYAAAAPIEVEKRLFQLFQLSAWLYEQTGGAFDITSGPLSKAWGFYERKGRVPEELEIADALAAVGSQHVVLDEAEQTVHFTHPGIEVNFNSIGKGYALDRLAEMLAQQDVDNYLWHGGSSSVLARGRNLASKHGAWGIGIRDPLTPERRIAEVHLRNQGLGTAGGGTQFFEHEGQRYGHILDPRTGKPATGTYTATAVAPTAAEADALATAFYVLGPGGTAEYCAAHQEVSALLTCPGSGDTEVDLHAFNLGENQWTRLG